MLTSISPTTTSNNDRHLNIPDVSPPYQTTIKHTRTRSTLKRMETGGIEDKEDDRKDEPFHERNSDMKPIKRVSSTGSMMAEDQIGRRQILWDTNYSRGTSNYSNIGKALIKAEEDECARHPVSIEGLNPPNVECSLLIKKIRSVDAIGSCVDSNLIFTLRWKSPHLIGKRVNKKSLWKPTLSIINYDKLDIVYEDPWFYPETGDVRLLIKVSGTFSNEQNLRFFPFDYDYINLDFCIELGTGDESARLSWDPSYAKTETKTGPSCLHRMIPRYVHKELKEWRIHEELTSARRHQPLNNIVGTMTGIQVRIHVTRKITYYIAKIYSLLWLMTFSSFYVLAMTTDTGVVDQETFNNRLNFSAALLLTSVSFIYVCGDSIPKLSYLTMIDFMMIHSFFTQFALMLETYLVFLMTSKCSNPALNCSDTIRSVDLYATIFIPLQYVLIQVLLIAYALCKRSRKFKKAKKNMTGVEPCLLARTRKEEERLAKKQLRWWQSFKLQELNKHRSK